MTTNIGFIMPGQVTKIRPDARSMEDDDKLGSLRERLLAAVTTFLGPEQTKQVLSATSDQLITNTRQAQIAGYVDALLMFFGTMHYSGKNDPSLIDRMKSDGIVPAVSGDSVGTLYAAFLPTPGETLEEQLMKFASGLSVTDKRGELIIKAGSQTFGGKPLEGGLSIAAGIDRANIDRIVAEANAEMLLSDDTYRLMPKAKVVKSNAPVIYGITSITPVSQLLDQKVREAGGKLLMHASPNFFHDSDVMAGAAREFGAYMSDRWVPRAGYTFVSNVTGRHMQKGFRIRRDLVKCVDHPVAVYTNSGKSVVKTFKEELGVTDVVAFNKEVANWLKTSGLRMHLITDLMSLQTEREALLSVIYAPPKEKERPYELSQQKAQII